MKRNQYNRSTVLRSRAIPVLLAAATLLPIGALGWLGARILQQEQAVERQHRRESLEVAAGRLALAIDSRLSDIEEQLTHGSGVRLTPEGLEAPRSAALLYQPVEIPVEAVSPAVFASADDLEFQRQEFSAAADADRSLAESPKPTIRGAALIRLGRVLRKAGDTAGALQAYSRLLDLGAVPVEGQPAALLARQARCSVFEPRGSAFKQGAAAAEALRKEASNLASELYSGGWRIDRPTFELYRDMLQKWAALLPPAAAIARTEAAIALWRAWRAGDLSPRGRRILRTPGATVLAVWTGGAEHPVVWLATPAELEASLAPILFT
jgi:hypothetical protein